MTNPAKTASRGARAAGRIVVGVDGSPASIDALRWAIDEARRRHAHVIAVNAWNYETVITAFPFSPSMSMVLDPEAVEHAAGLALHRSVRAALDDLRGTAPPIEERLVRGGAATVLIQEAEGADELVVASRGHGTIAGLLLGSVSQDCVRHASCPVVVIHPSGRTQQPQTLAG